MEVELEQEDEVVLSLEVVEQEELKLELVQKLMMKKMTKKRIDLVHVIEVALKRKLREVKH